MLLIVHKRRRCLHITVSLPSCLCPPLHPSQDYQPISQPGSQGVRESASQPGSQGVSQPASGAATQPARQPVSQSVSQSDRQKYRCRQIDRLSAFMCFCRPPLLPTSIPHSLSWPRFPPACLSAFPPACLSLQLTVCLPSCQSTCLLVCIPVYPFPFRTHWPDI